MLFYLALAMQMVPYAWRNPDIPISPPPETVGQQMGVVETIGQPPMGYTLDGQIKVFTLIAEPVETIFTDGDTSYWEIIPEKNRWTGPAMQTVSGKIKAWGFNGQVPGPTIEATEGDRVRIVVKNEIPEPTSVHWHGLILPNDMDGAGGVTQSPIMPGESFTYEFTLEQNGTFMYHTGFNVTKQDGYGLSGMFVIHPKDPPKKIDKDFCILLQEWAYAPGNETPHISTMEFNWFTFNGRVAPSIPVLTVHEGDRVRIRWGNLSMNSHPIHLHGYTWWVVGTEGGPIPESAQWPGATVNIAPGQTRDVEFVASNPGIWRLHCHKLHHIVNQHGDIPMNIMEPGGMYTYLHVKENK